MPGEGRGLSSRLTLLEPIFEADLPPEQTPTGRGGTPSRRRSQWKNCCFADIGKSSMPTLRISLGAFPIPS
jgi:hypothetical protein